jgi:hypothetical protein
VKIKLRLNCFGALGKNYNDHVVTGRLPRATSYSKTPCCCRQIKESVYHVLGDCPAYAVPRAECFARIGTRDPSFTGLSSIKKVDYIMGDDNPPNVDVHIYRLLYQIYQIRAKLVEPTLPGQGPLGLEAGPQGRAAL